MKKVSQIILAVLLCMGVMISQAVSVYTQTEVDRDVLNSGLETPGILRVGMEANYAPFNWSQTTDADGAYPIANASGEYANGLDVKVAIAIAEALDLELEIYKVEWDGLPPALESGKIDAIIAGMSPRPEQENQVDYSDPYYASDMVIVTRADSEYASATRLEDFAGAHLTGQLNTLHYDLLDQIDGLNKEVAMDSFPTMISSVLSGKIDGYISERPGAQAAVASNPDLTMVTFEDGAGFDYEPERTSVAVAMRNNSPLTPYVNEVISQSDDPDQMMSEMVDLNVRAESEGFWSEVGHIWEQYGSQFIRGAGTTLFIALVSTLVGFLIGLLIAIYRSLNIPNNPILGFLYQVINFILTAYIEIFRGTPMMVQAMLIFYGSKMFFNLDMSSLTAGLFIVSINTGAYLSEVIRGGIISVDEGQSEAGKALGMSQAQTMTYIVLPQAVRSTLPALGNEFVINIKDTSVLNVIAVTELFYVARSAAGTTYLTFQTFLIVSVIYFVLTYATTRLIRFIEIRMSGNKHYTVHQSSTSEVLLHD